MAKTKFIFDTETVTKPELDWLISSLSSIRRRRFPPPAKPVPVETVLLDERWENLYAWGRGNNGDASSLIVPNGVELSIRNARSLPNGTGARLFHIEPNGKWHSLPVGKTVTVTYPLTLPDALTVDAGEGKFLMLGIQGKADAETPLWSINAETVDGKMVAWLWLAHKGVTRRDGFPAYAVGTPNACTMRLHVAADTSGWLEFTLAGQTLRCDGVATCGAEGVGWGPVLYANSVEGARAQFGPLRVTVE